MISKKLSIVLSVFIVSSTFLVLPSQTFAAINNLNGLTGQNQSFANDTNITITSASHVHSIGWQGLLGISRGGTNANSFTNGSIFFFNGSAFAENNSNLFWDNTNNRLGVGTSSPTNTLSVSGNENVTGNLSVTGTISASNFNPTSYVPYNGAAANVDLGAHTLNVGTITSPSLTSLVPYSGAANDVNLGNHSLTLGVDNGNGFIRGVNSPDNGQAGGSIVLQAGSGKNSYHGGDVAIYGGGGRDPDGAGGIVKLEGGEGGPGGNSDGGSVEFRTGVKYGSGSYGVFRFLNQGQSSVFGILDFSSLSSSNKTFSLPNSSGTFGLLQSDQTWSGLNRVEDSTDTTLYVGSSSLTGCIALGDSDGNGVTYITANDGVLSASSSKPAICQ